MESDDRLASDSRRRVRLHAKTTRIEIHSLETVTLTNKQFLTGSKGGVSGRIGAELRLPACTPPAPAVVLIHGSAGVGTNVDCWARRLNGMGVAAFVLDCFTGRGIVETITDQSRLGHLTMIVDAYQAFNYLCNDPRIDSARIVVMGFSKGGSAALYSSLRRFGRMYGTARREFSGYIAFYPQCNTVYLDDEDASDRPIRLFHGTGDDYVSIEPARNYVARLQRAGKDVELKEYSGAHHAFDNPCYSPPRFLPDAVTARACSFREAAGGEIQNVGTGKPFRWSDPSIKTGATVGFDQTAAADAAREVQDLLSQWFGLIS